MIMMSKYSTGKLFIIALTLILLLSYIPLMVNQGVNGSPLEPSGNLYIQSGSTFIINESTIDPLTGQSGMFGMSGSLFVNASATLIIDNATLYFRQDIMHHFRMYVNGTLIMNNAVIETSYNAVQPYLPLNVSFYNANVKTNGAYFLFPGTVYFYRSILIFRNTYFDKLPGIPQQLNPGNVSASSPTPSFYFSTGYFDNVYFKNMFNPTPIIKTFFLNSSASKIPVNITAGSPPITEYASIKTSSFPVQTLVTGINVNINYKSTTAANVTLYLSGKNLPVANGILPSTNGGESSANISLNKTIPIIRLSQVFNNQLYAVIKIGSTTGYLNISRINFLLATNDTFNYYGGNSSFYFNMYSSTIYGMNVYIDSNFLNDTLSNGLERNIKNLITLESDSNLYVANLTIGGSIDGTNLMTDNAPFLVDSSSSINIFRYVKVNVINAQGYPVSGLKISYSETWPSNYPNAQQYDALADSLNLNLQNILTSENFIPSNFDVTNQGTSLIPLVSDIFTNSTSPNTLIMGHYELVLPGGLTTNVTLNSYPSLNSSSNTEKINITYDSPFVYYYLNSVPQFIYGNTENIGVTVLSYGGAINGTFVLLNNSVELAATGVSLKANSSSNIAISYVDNLIPGKHNLTLEFTSDQIYSSNSAINFNVTSFSNVRLVTSATLLPKYEMNGNMISGYGGELNVSIKNLGNQSSGVIKINTNYTVSSGQVYSLPVMAVVNARSSINESFVIPPINVSTPSTVNVKITVSTSQGVIPYSTSGENFSLSYPIIPTPYVSIVSASFNQTYLFGLNVNGILNLNSNEPVSNIEISLLVNGRDLNYKIPSVNGFTSVPISIPSNYVTLGSNNANISINNTGMPYLKIAVPTSVSFTVEKNYEFEIQNVNFTLNSDITNIINGTLSFSISNLGSFSVNQVPVQILYNGNQVYESNETVNVPLLIPMNLTYAPTMNFEIVVDYNYVYPTSYTYYPFMYYNSSLPYPYFFTTSSLPSQVTNGSAIKGYFSINYIANHYSNDTSLYLYLGNYILFETNIGNISKGYSSTFNINVSTAAIPDIMEGASVISYDTYFVIKDSETSSFSIKINSGPITILEKPNFVITNITVITNGHNSTTVYAGESFTVQFDITNNGGLQSTVNIPFKILGENNTVTMLFYKGMVNQSISPGQTIIISTSPISTKTIFAGSLFIFLNYNNTVNTKIKGAENYSIPFRIINPRIIFIITPLTANIQTGSVETLEIKALNSNNSQPWQTNFTLTLMQGTKIVERVNGKTNLLGIYTLTFKVVNSGNYNVLINYQGPTGQLTQSYSNVFEVRQAPIEIPFFVYPIVIVIVTIIVFLFVTRYLKNKYTGLVQCSVCGAILPEGATKCPRCGTEFEKDRVKCSECGSWIPEDSKYCPNCGALFIGKQDPQFAGITKLKSEYDQFLENYRQKARAILGDKMNNIEFQNWWRNSPDYKGFRQWIMEKGLSPEEFEGNKNENNNEKDGSINIRVEKKKGLLRRRKKE